MRMRTEEKPNKKMEAYKKKKETYASGGIRVLLFLLFLGLDFLFFFFFLISFLGYNVSLCGLTHAGN